MKKTAVEWLIDEMFKDVINVTKENNPSLFNIIQQAKEIEKQQIIEAYILPDDIRDNKWKISKQDRAEQYYNETFKNEMK